MPTIQVINCTEKLHSHPQQVNSTEVCASKIPDLVIKQVRSSIECTILCKGTGGCASVNWKKPSTCELYGTKQTTFVVAPSCTSMNSGKECKFFALVCSENIVVTIPECWSGNPCARVPSVCQHTMRFNPTAQFVHYYYVIYITATGTIIL